MKLFTIGRQQTGLRGDKCRRCIRTGRKIAQINLWSDWNRSLDGQ